MLLCAWTLNVVESIVRDLPAHASERGNHNVIRYPRCGMMGSDPGLYTTSLNGDRQCYLRGLLEETNPGCQNEDLLETRVGRATSGVQNSNLTNELELSTCLR